MVAVARIKVKTFTMIKELLPYGVVKLSVVDKEKNIGRAEVYFTSDGEATLEILEVDKKYRRMGLGTKMMQEIVNLLDERNIPCHLYVLVNKEFDLVKWYEKFGFNLSKTFLNFMWRPVCKS